jgi:protein-disulfide isomerase
MNKTFWAIIAAIIIIFGGIIVINKDKATAPSGSAQPTNHIVGSTVTGVKLVEYADYQCPFCGQYYPLVKQVVDKYKDRIEFQYRNLPLLQVHQNALAAARAAEAADKQGKFWEMHDIIFENQKNWSQSTNASSIFEQYAVQLGLKVEQFKTDAKSSAINGIINADINEFKKTKETMSTPTFFLDGKKIQPTSLDEFSQLIDREIANRQSS